MIYSLTMLLKRLILRFNLVPDEAMDLMARQALEICSLNWELAQARLRSEREFRDLISQFRMALDQEDQVGLRETLDAAIIDLSDQVARSEEHLV